uniref:Uncharacterized protein n=1 Tax=Oryza sativa subsp. japonica TaxID=39947 RepID=Q6YTB1_ORYSJ|nr:hypothetical protein [Oryza sativa Japonica Group]BAC99946.1 hypothetical protein [Oryza sativa Japonica Group]
MLPRRTLPRSRRYAARTRRRSTAVCCPAARRRAAIILLPGRAPPSRRRALLPRREQSPAYFLHAPPSRRRALLPRRAAAGLLPARAVEPPPERLFARRHHLARWEVYGREVRRWVGGIGPWQFHTAPALSKLELGARAVPNMPSCTY